MVVITLNRLKPPPPNPQYLLPTFQGGASVVVYSLIVNVCPLSVHPFYLR